MAFNTGNSLGSTDPRDLSDNSENFDRFANGSDPAYNDRFGTSRKSFSGMESDFQQFLLDSGYVGTGASGAYEDYDTDGPLTITARNEIFTISGEFYRAKASLSLPYTTTGTWVGDDEARFVSVGDAALRQELANSPSTGQGATLVNGATIYVGAVAEGISGLTGVADAAYHVIDWHPGGAAKADPQGGGTFTFKSGVAKSQHNGGTIISPTVPPVSAQAGASFAERVANFLAGAGETDPAGSGVFVRVNDTLGSNSVEVFSEWWGGYNDGTQPVVTLGAMNAAKSYIKSQSGAAGTIKCPGNYLISDVFTLDAQGICIEGVSSWGSNIGLDSGAAGAAAITVAARLCEISNIKVTAPDTKDCVYLKLGQLFKSRNLTTKFGRYGVFHQNGNSVDITGYFSESCGRGYFIQPNGAGDCNGGYIHGRSINCEFGFVFAANTGAGKDPLHNEIHYSTEGNTVGINQAGGYYNYFNFYSESNSRASTQGNTNANWVTDDSPNIWNIRNPDNDTGIIKGFAGGWETRGLNIYHDPCWGVERISTVVFDVSKSLAGVAIKKFYVTNPSGATRGATLSFLASAPIGYVGYVFKTDNTPGLTLVAPTGITFVGDASEFGASPGAQTDVLTCTKISATEVLLTRYRG